MPERSAREAYVPSIIQQFFPEYHGLVYYWCKFTPSMLKSETDRVILRFGGVDYKADAWLNGIFLGTRECPETPFEFDVARRVVNDLSIKRYPRWLYHPECVLAGRDVFAGVGRGLAILRDFGPVFPSYGFETETTPDYPVCPMFATGYDAAELGYMLAHAVMGYRFGAGKVFFSTLELLHNLDYPMADRILSNLVGMPQKI